MTPWLYTQALWLKACLKKRLNNSQQLPRVFVFPSTPSLEGKCLKPGGGNLPANTALALKGDGPEHQGT